jgi:hypothetical protein
VTNEIYEAYCIKLNLACNFTWRTSDWSVDFASIQMALVHLHAIGGILCSLGLRWPRMCSPDQGASA